MSITKITASQLFGCGYQLEDKEGNVYDIVAVSQRSFLISQPNHKETVFFDEIGETFFIRCRPLSSLTQTIEHEGENIVPIMRLAEIEHAPFKIDIFNKHSSSDNKILWVDFTCEEFKQEIRFCYCIDSFQKGYISDMSHWIVKRQPELFHTLYSMHFKPTALTDEQCRWIND